MEKQRKATYPKILVGCPTYAGKAYALDKYVEALKKIDYPNFDILLVDNSDGDEYLNYIKSKGIPVIKGPSHPNPIERIVLSRNILRQKCLEGEYKYLLSLEQDVLPPPDVIHQLLASKIPIVSGLYYNIFTNNFGKQEQRPLAYAAVHPKQFEILKTDKRYEGTPIRKKIEEGIIKGPMDIHAQLSMKEVVQPRLIHVLYTGLGCMFIRRDVLEKIEFKPSKTSFDDYVFCREAQEKGYEVWLNTAVKCEHVISVKNDTKAETNAH